MPVTVSGLTYYRTAEVCQMAGIGRTTLFRWLKGSVANEAEHRDRRGWRLFTEDDERDLRTEANRVNIINWNREASKVG